MNPKSPTAAQSDAVPTAIAVLLLSVTAMAFADALIKLFSAELSLWQIFFARSVIGLPCLLFVARAAGATLLARSPWAWLRSVLLVMCWITYYASLPYLDLSVAAVAVYTNPVITALLVAFGLRESVTPRQMIGVALGFVGVIIIIKPGTDAFSIWVVLPLLAALFYSFAMIITRVKCRHEDSLALGVALHSTFLIVGCVGLAALHVLPVPAAWQTASPFLVTGWAPMDATSWGVMALLGVLSAAYFAGVARAYQTAPPQILATFDYGYLVSAGVCGYFFFNEVPDGLTALGMVTITVAGVLVVQKSQQRSNTEKQQP